MDNKQEYYRGIIKKILSEYYEVTVKGSIAIDELQTEHHLAFDEERDQYLWFRSSWDGKQRIRHFIIYLQIQNGKIWVEEDSTDLCVVDDLLASGISKSDIVLGFQHPSKRAFTEFAIA